MSMTRSKQTQTEIDRYTEHIVRRLGVSLIEAFPEYYRPKQQNGLGRDFLWCLAQVCKREQDVHVLRAHLLQVRNAKRNGSSGTGWNITIADLKTVQQFYEDHMSDGSQIRLSEGQTRALKSGTTSPMPRDPDAGFAPRSSQRVQMASPAGHPLASSTSSEGKEPLSPSTMPPSKPAQASRPRLILRYKVPSAQQSSAKADTSEEGQVRAHSHSSSDAGVRRGRKGVQLISRCAKKFAPSIDPRTHRVPKRTNTPGDAQPSPQYVSDDSDDIPILSKKRKIAGGSLNNAASAVDQKPKPANDATNPVPAYDYQTRSKRRSHSDYKDGDPQTENQSMPVFHNLATMTDFASVEFSVQVPVPKQPYTYRQVSNAEDLQRMCVEAKTLHLHEQRSAPARPATPRPSGPANPTRIFLDHVQKAFTDKMLFVMAATLHSRKRPLVPLEIERVTALGDAFLSDFHGAMGRFENGCREMGLLPAEDETPKRSVRPARPVHPDGSSNATSVRVAEPVIIDLEDSSDSSAQTNNRPANTARPIIIDLQDSSGSSDEDH